MSIVRDFAVIYVRINIELTYLEWFFQWLFSSTYLAKTLNRLKIKVKIKKRRMLNWASCGILLPNYV